MLQTVATLFSLLFASGAMAIIVASVADDWVALRRALAGHDAAFASALPARTRQLKPARRARMIRFSPEAVPQRAVA